MRLINPDTIKLPEVAGYDGDGDALVSVRDVRKAIAMTPKVDAAEVIHAHWEDAISPNSIVCAGRDGCYEEMKWLKYIEENYFYGRLPAYCPHCGAKMDAKEATCNGKVHPVC